jgi:squalene-hopene/tetraprenyl-beta-curcumene cyclase
LSDDRDMDEIIRNTVGRIFSHSAKQDQEVSPADSLRNSFVARDNSALAANITGAVSKTQSYYFEHQHSDGYWWYELESNVTITAEYLMLLYFLGLNTKEKDRKIANYILKKQRMDGSWTIHYGAKGDLSTTVEAYFALRLAGYSPEDLRLRSAQAFILENGGVEGSRVFTRIFLALFGEFSWKAIPSIPIELNLLPSWFPVNIYVFSSWARSTVVPLSVLLDLRPVKPLLGGDSMRALYRDPDSLPHLTVRKLPVFSLKKLFVVLDHIFKVWEKFKLRPLRRLALKKTERWIREHQEPSGDWGGIQPAMVNSIWALVARGYSVSHGTINRGLKALERYTIETEDELVLQSCISPVWDTALTALALESSGVKRDHFSVLQASKWLASQQIFRKGDWSVKLPDLPPGGWAFEFDNSWYPDVDDTAVVLMMLYRHLDKDFISPENLDSGLRWILGMQGRDGGWGAFDVNNNMRLLNQLPFGDLEAMIDPSTVDLTGRSLEVLGLAGYDLTSRPVKRALAFIKKNQENDGSWWGRWGVNYIYGTWSVLSGIASVGEDMSRPYVRYAVRWLKKTQRPDGGWGECCESYEDPSLKCSGNSTPSQTAWAMLGLMAAGEGRSETVCRGAEYLLSRQLTDGTWHEEEFTGTGFPKYFMIRYHNYRNCFPLMALGRFHSLIERKGKER